MSSRAQHGSSLHSGRRGATRRKLHRLAPLLLLVFFGIGMTQVVRASITFDEGPHLAVGYTTLRTRDLRLQPIHIHPPLANVLAAAPLLLQPDLPDPTQVSGWEINSLSAITDAVVWQYPDPRRLAVAGRLPILLLGTLLGALVFRWGKEVGGIYTGMLALCLYALDPNLVAHGALITTDMAATAFIVGTLYATYKLLQPERAKPRALPSSALHLAATGAFLGLAQLAKVSTLMLLPVVAFLLLISALIEGGRRAWRRAVIQGSVILACAALTLWAGYGFEVGSVAGLGSAVPAATHVKIFQSLETHYQLGHPTFAAGKLSTHGWWWYFPLAFVLKTPLPVLLLAVAALIIQGRRWVRDARCRGTSFLTEVPATLAWVLFPLLYAGAALFSTVNIGYRHLLPLLPFLYIGIGTAFGRQRSPTLRTLALSGSILWIAFGTLRTLPYPLTFFNELAGGPAGGYRYLVDSNLDWGQNLWDLKEWLDEHSTTRVAYAHFSPARPASYGIDVAYLPPDPRAVPYTPWHPEPGSYAIGATVLQGAYTPDINTYAWFRSRTPLARLGHALFLYAVPATPAPEWSVLCGTEIAPAFVAHQLNNDDLRVLTPLCDQAMVYPAGDAAGLLVIPDQVTRPPEGDLWLELRNTDGQITTRVFRIEDGYPAPATTAPELEIDGPLAFTGHTLDNKLVPGKELHLRTYWQVTGLADRPLSLMAHLISEQGGVVAVGDGMGFPIDQWHVGDLMVQRHSFAVPEGLEPGARLTIEIGAYWLDTIERWPIDGSTQGLPVAVLTVGQP